MTLIREVQRYDKLFFVYENQHKRRKRIAEIY